MGADQVIDYTAEDYTRSGKYDLILDLVCEWSMFAIRRALAPGGRYSSLYARLFDVSNAQPGRVEFGDPSGATGAPIDLV